MEGADGTYYDSVLQGRKGRTINQLMKHIFSKIWYSLSSGKKYEFNLIWLKKGQREPRP